MAKGLSTARQPALILVPVNGPYSGFLFHCYSHPYDQFVEEVIDGGRSQKRGRSKTLDESWSGGGRRRLAVRRKSSRTASRPRRRRAGGRPPRRASWRRPDHLPPGRTLRADPGACPSRRQEHQRVCRGDPRTAGPGPGPQQEQAAQGNAAGSRRGRRGGTIRSRRGRGVGGDERRHAAQCFRRLEVRALALRRRVTVNLSDDLSRHRMTNFLPGPSNVTRK